MSGEDLRAILGLREERFAAELTAHRLDDVSERRVLGRARRARGMRVGVSAVAAAVVAALFGVGVWALVGENDREPLVTPPSATAVTSSSSPTPTPSATPSPSPQIVFQEPLPADEFFLEAKQLTEDIWQSADEGWSLTYWQPSRQLWGEAGQEVTDSGVAAVYLMDDNGNRYEVSHFDVPLGALTTLLAWEPTDFTAIVVFDAEERKDERASDPHLALLDIRTGDITAGDAITPVWQFIGVNANGDLLFQSGDMGDDVTVFDRSLAAVGSFQGLGHASLSPDGTTLVTATLDYWERPVSVAAASATTGEALWVQDVSAVASERDCSASGWITRNTPALTCMDYSTDPDFNSDFTVNRTTFFAVDRDGLSAVVERSEDLSWSGPYPLRTGLVACGGETSEGSDGCSLYSIEDALLAPLQTTNGALSNYALIESGEVFALRDATYGDALSVTATRYDTGRTFIVTPRKGDDPTWWWTTITEVVFAGATGQPY